MLKLPHNHSAIKLIPHTYNKELTYEQSNKPNYNNLKLCTKKKAKLGNPTDIARMAAPKAAQIIYNAIRIGPRVILRSAFELLRANTITRLISVIVLLAIDIVSLSRKRISKKQFVINVMLALILLVGGTAGWYLGNNLAAIIIAEGIVISIIAGILGAGILGASLGVAWEKLIKLFIKDDTADMLDICNQVFCQCATQYNLTESEALQASTLIEIESTAIKNMYASPNKEDFARCLIEPHLQEITNQRDPQKTQT